MPVNVASDSFGFRFTRAHLFYDVEIDHNDVHLPLSNQNYSWFANSDTIVFTTAADLAANVIACGGDPNCVPMPGYESNGLNADPLLALGNADPLEAANFALTALSPPIDAGAFVGVTTDYAGRPVPTRLAPDIGAFEAPRDRDGDGVFDPEDNCRGDSNPGQADQDIDGRGDVCDCAPQDGSAREPDEVAGLAAEIVPATTTVRLSWPEVAGADSYSVTRGLLLSLAPGSYGACRATGIQGTEFDDGDAPPSGDGFAYLVQGDDLVCGAGSLGADSQWAERVNGDPSACP